ncbi:hypothetical protein FB45DRAFT_875336 [Roridomyces roridus]|uniref:Uncharacterized protein n=1 Tax=Roridomyces roridus TaxID=1738132 RepID=A0AAD7B6S2_9AGAR|nr:hypothetical protein FB45DRAFT_875336 [Roridomyces roridus]
MSRHPLLRSEHCVSARPEVDPAPGHTRIDIEADSRFQVSEGWEEKKGIWALVTDLDASSPDISTLKSLRSFPLLGRFPFSEYAESPSAYLLVCKSWLRVATPLLYSVVIIRSKGQAKALGRALSDNQELGQWIKHLRVEGGFGTPMLAILKASPNITDLYLTLEIFASDNTAGLCDGLSLIQPQRLIIKDISWRPKHNKMISRLVDALAAAIPKWQRLSVFRSQNIDSLRMERGGILPALAAAKKLEEITVQCLDDAVDAYSLFQDCPLRAIQVLEAVKPITLERVEWDAQSPSLKKRLGLPHYYTHVALDYSDASLHFLLVLSKNPSLGERVRTIRGGSTMSDAYDSDNEDDDVVRDESNVKVMSQLTGLTEVYGLYSNIRHGFLRNLQNSISWDAFAAVAQSSGPTLQDLSVPILHCGHVSPMVFAQLDRLRSLTWNCDAHFTNDIQEQVPPTALSKLAELQVLTAQPSFLEVLSLMELPSLRHVLAEHSEPELWAFLGVHGVKLTHLDTLEVPILEVCPNLQNLAFCARATHIENNMLTLEHLLSGSNKAASLEKIKFEVEYRQKHEENAWGDLINTLGSTLFPQLREVQFPSCTWPKKERDISKSNWIRWSEMLHKKGIHLTDAEGGKWRSRRGNLAAISNCDTATIKRVFSAYHDHQRKAAIPVKPETRRMPDNSLPDEIVSEILAPALKVPDDKFSDLSAVSPFAAYAESPSACLVCKSWLRVATPLLYHVVVLRSKAQAKALEATLIQNPDLGKFIKHLRVEGGYGPSMRTILGSTCHRPFLVSGCLILHDDATVRNQTARQMANGIAAAIHWILTRVYLISCRSTIVAALKAAGKLQWLTVATLSGAETAHHFFFHSCPLKSVQVTAPVLTSHLNLLYWTKLPDSYKDIVKYQRTEDPETDSFPSHILPLRQFSSTPMESEPREVQDKTWSRILHFFLAIPPFKNYKEGDRTPPNTSSRLAFLLVSRTFYRLGLAHYYTHVSLVSSDAPAKFGVVLANNPSLGQDVKTILGGFNMSPYYDPGYDSGSESVVDHSDPAPWTLSVMPQLTGLTKLCGLYSEGNDAMTNDFLQRFEDPISWDAFLAVVKSSSRTLQEISVPFLYEAEVSPAVFGQLGELRSLTWRSKADFAYTARDVPLKGLPKLADLSLFDTHKSFLEVLSLMELPALKRVLVKDSENGLKPWRFLRAHGKKLVELEMTYFDLYDWEDPILEVCPNIRILKFFSWDDRGDTLESKHFLSGSAVASSLEKIVFKMDCHKKQDNGWIALLSSLEPTRFPKLREVQFLACKWPTKEHEISKKYGAYNVQ